MGFQPVRVVRGGLAGGPPLRWVHGGILKMHIVLVRGEEVIATLRFKGSFATVENADDCWAWVMTQNLEL